jgi:V-type H+-transporting ATPase subunit C
MSAGVAVGQEFWIVAAGCAKQGNQGDAQKESLLSDLKSSSVLGSRSSNLGPWKFAVPDGERSLLFGSFDNLIRLTDDLAKADSQVDSILHRLERQYVEVDPKAQFKVTTQRQEKEFLKYLEQWQWDEAKYPKTRNILDNLTLLMSVVNKLDEEARNKTAQYNEYKTQKANIGKKDGALMTGRDLIDVLTPETGIRMGSGKPEEDDFIYTEHLTTIPVILAKGGEVEFLKVYETMSDHVVPKSAKPFKGAVDKEGNSIWRVVVFRSAAEAFKKACRERKFTVRDFEYSEEAYKKLQASRAELETQVQKQFELVKGLYKAAWSDTVVAWIHIKAMRVFVESVLRFGMPPKFAAFIVSPKASSAQAARKALADKLGASGGGADKTADGMEDGEEYYPYVSFSFTPFNVPR